MNQFLPAQRWISEGEPELGVGLVLEVGNGRVKVFFPSSDETRLYAEANAPLRRVVFKTGDSVPDDEGKMLRIEDVVEDDGIIWYIGEGRRISEARLGNVSVQHGVEELLLEGKVDSPHLFALRRETLQMEYLRRTSPVNGFVGGRIDLIPHQLYIAHEVSRRYAPRVLLSDEVGLGKTIEACLILHRLLLQGSISRVLILVPETLVHQWFVELLRRFNLWFHIFDEERCEALEESAPDGNPFLDDQLIICSTDFLTNSPKRAMQALQAEWDMLVVDEAHHLRWSEEEVSQAYSVVEALSQVAKALLLLTATPEQLGLESHFARLRLLDPDRYVDFRRFQDEVEDHREVADLVEKLSEAKALSKEEKQLLGQLIEADKLDRLSNDEVGTREQIVEDLLDQHGPGRVIFRNTRAAMQGFPERKVHMMSLQSEFLPDVWIDRMREEFRLDASGSKKRVRLQLSDDPRVDWLLGLMAKLDSQKVLLICRTKAKVLALEKAMQEKSGIPIGIFHEDLSIVQRDRNAAWFAEKNGAQLLICSEIGSEGRNFQFAHHLVLFDVPMQPELLEQRIGRLDRIGQTEEIQIHVPFAKDAPQEQLAHWYHEGLNAFEENLVGGNQAGRHFGPRLLDLLTAENWDKQAFSDLLTETKEFHAERKQMLAKGRDRLLEMNSFRPKVSEELIRNIHRQDQDPGLETFMTRVFTQFGVEMEDLAPRTYLLHAPRNNDPFPGVPDEGISVTFDRKRALSREDIQFISWDHPMTTGAIDMVLSGSTGSAGYGVLRAGGRPAMLLETVFVLESSGGRHLDIDRFLPPKPLRVVVDHRGADVGEDFTAELFDHRLIPGFLDELPGFEALSENMLPDMIDAATSIADDLAHTEMIRSLRAMDQQMDHEIDRLKSLQTKNQNIRPDEIEAAEAQQAALNDLIRNATVRLDSVMLVKVE